MRVEERFLTYVSYWTTSDEENSTKDGAVNIPSSDRQFALAKVLEQELKDLGLTRVRLTDHCYVYGLLPATPGYEHKKAVGFISHMDTAPDYSGENVKPQIIKNYDGENNITKVTSQQYAMVAQMAGVTDVSIVVTANRPVSGESALTGVYKALATDGVSLNTQNTSTANQMLEATQPAIDANKDDKTYPGKLMAAIGDVSKQLAEMKQDNKNLATKQDIQDMLNKALEKRGIEDKTSSTNVTQITNALFNFQNSPISSSKNYVKNVDNTINNVKNSAGNLMNKAKNWANSQSGKKTISEAKSLWQKFVDWIKGLFS